MIRVSRRGVIPLGHTFLARWVGETSLGRRWSLWRRDEKNLQTDHHIVGWLGVLITDQGETYVDHGRAELYEIDQAWGAALEMAARHGIEVEAWSAKLEERYHGPET